MTNTPKFLASMVLAGIWLLPVCGLSANPPEGSLCGTDERVYFDCAVSGKKGPKRLSLCGSKNPSDPNAYLQYRFGKLGDLELEYPSPKADPRKTFRFSHYSRFQVSRTAVGFTREGTNYWIFDSYEGDIKPASRTYGVEVSAAGQSGKSQVISCKGAVASDLGGLETVLPCAKDDPLNMGECP